MLTLNPCPKCGGKIKVESDINVKTGRFTRVTTCCLDCNTTYRNIKPQNGEKLKDLRKESAKWWNEHSKNFAN